MMRARVTARTNMDEVACEEVSQEFKSRRPLIGKSELTIIEDCQSG